MVYGVPLLGYHSSASVKLCTSVWLLCYHSSVRATWCTSVPLLCYKFTTVHCGQHGAPVYRCYVTSLPQFHEGSMVHQCTDAVSIVQRGRHSVPLQSYNSSVWVARCIVVLLLCCHSSVWIAQCTSVSLQCYHSSVWVTWCTSVPLLCYNSSVWVALCTSVPLLCYHSSVWIARCTSVPLLCYNSSMWVAQCTSVSLLCIILTNFIKLLDFEWFYAWPRDWLQYEYGYLSIGSNGC